jgi:hypothetical protein
MSLALLTVLPKREIKQFLVSLSPLQSLTSPKRVSLKAWQDVHGVRVERGETVTFADLSKQFEEKNLFTNATLEAITEVKVKVKAEAEVKVAVEEVETQGGALEQARATQEAQIEAFVAGLQKSPHLESLSLELNRAFEIFSQIIPKNIADDEGRASYLDDLIHVEDRDLSGLYADVTAFTSLAQLAQLAQQAQQAKQQAKQEQAKEAATVIQKHARGRGVRAEAKVEVAKAAATVIQKHARGRAGKAAAAEAAAAAAAAEAKDVTIGNAILDKLQETTQARKDLAVEPGGGALAAEPGGGALAAEPGGGALAAGAQKKVQGKAVAEPHWAILMEKARAFQGAGGKTAANAGALLGALENYKRARGFKKNLVGWINKGARSNVLGPARFRPVKSAAAKTAKKTVTDSVQTSGKENKPSQQRTPPTSTKEHPPKPAATPTTSRSKSE